MASPDGAASFQPLLQRIKEVTEQGAGNFSDRLIHAGLIDGDYLRPNLDDPTMSVEALRASPQITVHILEKTHHEENTKGLGRIWDTFKDYTIKDAKLRVTLLFRLDSELMRERFQDILSEVGDVCESVENGLTSPESMRTTAGGAQTGLVGGDLNHIRTVIAEPKWGATGGFVKANLEFTAILIMNYAAS